MRYFHKKYSFQAIIREYKSPRPSEYISSIQKNKIKGRMMHKKNICNDSYGLIAKICNIPHEWHEVLIFITHTKLFQLLFCFFVYPNQKKD